MERNVQVILPTDLDKSLRQYFYEVAKEAVEKVRIETSLNKEIFRLGEACDYLSCDRATLRKFINKKGLKVSVIDGCQFIRKEELTRFIMCYEV
ncbi:helix-turn-helix domain-containing protein [Enterococcus sp. LJL98]